MLTKRSALGGLSVRAEIQPHGAKRLRSSAELEPEDFPPLTFLVLMESVLPGCLGG